MAVQTIHRAAGRRYGPSALSRASQTQPVPSPVATRSGVLRNSGRTTRISEPRGMTAHRPVPDTGAEQARTGRTAVQGGPAAVSVHQPVDRPTQQHVHRPAAAGQAGGRYPRVGDARGTRPTAGTVRHRNRVTVTSCPPGSAAGGYRMGRWARLAMTVVVTAAIVVATLTVLLRPAAVPTRFVTVQPGDTLASIAVRALPDLDPADAIGVVESMNGLDGATVQVGAVLRVPAGDGNR